MISVTLITPNYSYGEEKCIDEKINSFRWVWGNAGSTETGALSGPLRWAISHDKINFDHPNSDASDLQIPLYMIYSIAEWWGSGAICDQTFFNAMEYYLKHDVVRFVEFGKGCFC